jgi:hypothetical protein
MSSDENEVDMSLRRMRRAVLGVALATQLGTCVAGAAEPLVPEGLAVTHVLVADDATAREWFRSADGESGDEMKKPGVPLLAELRGMDEADVVALHVVVTGQDAAVSARLLVTDVAGNHGALERLAPQMVSAISHATVTPALLPQVQALAATLRGEPKPSEDDQLSTDDLTTLVTACRKSGGRPVFLILSE